MKTMMEFLKKEWMEQVRNSKVLILVILFVLFGIMNPAIAKLTPWMMEMLSDSLAEAGMMVVEVESDAMTSWIQFIKNIPMGLIAFVLIESNLFTREYETGTLILTLTKGLERYKVVLSKTIILLFLWTACYFLCYGITYAYNAYYWDNSIAKNLFFTAICWWLLGVWVVILMVFFSTIAKNNTTVLMGTGGVFLGSYLIGLIPKAAEYMPTMLMNSNSLLMGVVKVEDYQKSLFITIVLCIVLIICSIPIMNKRKL